MRTLQVREVGKRYRVRRPRHREGFRDVVSRPAQLPGRALRFLWPERDDWFWALRNVSFDADRGETIGVVGENGVGKSTLLKLVSRITLPSTGHVELRGRVASLLEAGAAFHPELNGRENILLAGAIAGMKRAEVNARLNDIVEFAEVSQFLELPLKHYSTGMYLRLAFAVTAHLASELAVIDEVLSVADARFREKALLRIRQMATDGTLVLFVSHNLEMVRELCQRVLVLAPGTLRFDGPTRDGLELYARLGADAPPP